MHLAGWKGEDCLTNIDDCVGNRCYYGATCVDGVNFYSCQCPPGRTGEYECIILRLDLSAQSEIQMTV